MSICRENSTQTGVNRPYPNTMTVDPRRIIFLMKFLDSFEEIAINSIKNRVILCQLMVTELLINKQVIKARHQQENILDSGSKRIIRGLNPNLTGENGGERRCDIGESDQ
jgi:hypothetical protein